MLWVASDDYDASLPSGWTLARGQESNVGHYLWYKWATGAETSVTYTIGSATGSWYALIAATGLDSATAPIVNSQSTLSSGTAYTTGAITPTAGSDWAVFGSIAGVHYGGYTATSLSTWLNSYTEIADTAGDNSSSANVTLGVAWLDNVTGGSSASTGATRSMTADCRSGLIVAFKVASAGPVNAPADPAALTLTGVTPDLAGSGSAAAPADPASVMLSGLTPTLTGSGAVVIAVDTAVLSLTGNTPTLTGTSAAIAVDPAPIAFGGQDPTLIGSGSAAIAVDSAALTLTGVTPITDATLLVQVDTAILQLGGQTSALTGSGAASIAADIALLTLGAVEPALAGAGAASVAVDTALLALSGQTPAITGSSAAAVAVDVASLTLTGVTPQIAGGPAIAIVDAAVLTLAGVTPTVSGAPVIMPLVASRIRTGPAIASTRTPDASTITVRTGRPTIRVHTPEPLQ